MYEVVKTGHNYFCKYPFKMGKMIGPNCIYGNASIDDAEHTFFHCEKWRLETRNLEPKAARKIGIAWPVTLRPC